MEAYKEYTAPTGVTKVGLYLSKEDVEKFRMVYNSLSVQSDTYSWIACDLLNAIITEAEK